MDDRTFEALKRVMALPELVRELKNHRWGYKRAKPIGEDIEIVADFIRDRERALAKTGKALVEETGNGMAKMLPGHSVGIVITAPDGTTGIYAASDEGRAGDWSGHDEWKS
jgi:hypothetical protein